jgi:sec-independent protein translocase protein TatA
LLRRLRYRQTSQQERSKVDMGVGVIEPWHLVLILIIALVIFGPGKLGDVGGSLGRGIREFKSSMKLDEEQEKPQDAAKASDAKPANGVVKADVVAAKQEAADKAS